MRSETSAYWEIALQRMSTKEARGGVFFMGSYNSYAIEDLQMAGVWCKSVGKLRTNQNTLQICPKVKVWNALRDLVPLQR